MSDNGRNLGGAPKGNRNRLVTGLYSRGFVALRREHRALLEALKRNVEDVTLAQIGKLNRSAEKVRKVAEAALSQAEKGDGELKAAMSAHREYRETVKDLDLLHDRLLQRARDLAPGGPEILESYTVPDDPPPLEGDRGEGGTDSEEEAAPDCRGPSEERGTDSAGVDPADS